MRARWRAGISGTLLAAALALPGCASDEERRAEHLARAEQYLAAEKPREALIELRSALRLAPGDADTNFRIARVLDAMGQLGDARFYYGETHRLDPDHSEAALAHAQLLFGDDPDRAEELIEGVLERDPANLLAHVRRSDLALVRADTEGALRAALTAAQLDPASPLPHLQLGIVRRAQIRERRLRGQPDDEALFQQALEAFDGGLERLDESSPGLLVRAWAERALVLASWPARAAEAGTAFRRAAEVARRFPAQELGALATAARYARSAGDAELEDWALRRTVEIAPDSYAAWDRLAELAEAQGRSATGLLEQLLGQRPRDARAHALYARRLDAQGQHPKALAHLRQVAPQTDDPAVALAALADLHLAWGEVEAARPIVEGLRREQPDHQETGFAAAHLAFADGRYAEAAEALRALLDRGEIPRALYLLAETEHRLGDHAGALAALDRAMALREGPPPVDWLRLKARLQVAAGDWAAAVRSYRLVRRRSGGRLVAGDVAPLARALYALGRDEPARRQLELALALPDPPVEAVLIFAAHERERAPARVRELLERTAERHPDHLLLLEHLTRLDLAQGRADAALRRLDAALERRPDAARIRALRARVLASQGRPDAALADVEKALETDPELPGGTLLLIGLLQQLGRQEEALRSLEEARAAGRLGLPGRILLGRLRLERGEDEPARALFEEALAERADLPGVKNDLAFLLARQGRDLPRALELARSARSAQPNSSAFADTLGFVYLAMGLADAALSQFQSAIALAAEGSSTWATAQYHLGLAHKSLGREAEALHAFERALAAATEFPEAGATRRELEALQGAGGRPSSRSGAGAGLARRVAAPTFPAGA